MSRAPGTRRRSWPRLRPVLFNPVLVENYQDCKKAKPVWLLAAEERTAGDPQLAPVTEVAGGTRVFMEKVGRKPPSRLVIISVNASTDPEPQRDTSNK